jgi:UPF0716 protein FxsA
MLLALILCIAWPLAELYVAVKVAEAIGVLLTIVLLIASWPVGTWALRSQSRAAWMRVRAALATGRPPGREALDGALVLGGGVMLIIPGFITDAAALLLLAPPTRSVLRRLLVRNFHSRLIRRAARFSARGRSYDVDSTARDINPPRLHP